MNDYYLISIRLLIPGMVLLVTGIITLYKRKEISKFSHRIVNLNKPFYGMRLYKFSFFYKTQYYGTVLTGVLIIFLAMILLFAFVLSLVI